MRARPFTHVVRAALYAVLLAVSSLAVAQPKVVTELPTPSEPCRFGSQVLPTPPKMPIRIMPSRYSDLLDTMEGFRRSGVPLVSFGIDGLQPSGYSDNAGLYYFVPAISRKFHQDLSRSISLFFGIPLIACFVIGAVGFALLFTTMAARVISTVALCLLFPIIARIGDVYLFEAAVPVLLIPWFLLLLRRDKSRKLLLVFMVVAGSVLATAAFIRTNAAMPTALFLCVGSVWYLRETVPWKVALVAALGVGMLVSMGLFSKVTSQRDRYILSHTTIAPADMERHMVWHVVYFGLGYLKLPSMPAVCDESSKAKVYLIDPAAAYLSSDYDRILRHEVFSLLAQHPVAVTATLLAKLAKTLGAALLFANIGLIAAWFYPKPKALEGTFACTLILAAGPVILVIPFWQYLVGVLAIATIYGIVSLGHALEVRAASTNIDRLQTLANARADTQHLG